MEIRNMLSRIVKAAAIARSHSTSMSTLGYPDNPYEAIFGELADAVYLLLGEKTDTFDESITCLALCNDLIPDEQRVDLIMSAM